MLRRSLVQFCSAPLVAVKGKCQGFRSRDYVSCVYSGGYAGLVFRIGGRNGSRSILAGSVPMDTEFPGDSTKAQSTALGLLYGPPACLLTRGGPSALSCWWGWGTWPAKATSYSIGSLPIAACGSSLAMGVIPGTNGGHPHREALKGSGGFPRPDAVGHPEN